MTKNLQCYLRVHTKLDEPQLDRVLSCFKPKAVKKNTVLLPEGAVCKELYFIHSGCIRTYYRTIQGQEKTRYIAFANSIATSISSFISQQASTEFVDVLEDAELFAISHQDFYQLADEIPPWASFYRRLLELSYLYQNRMIENLVTLSAKQRYDRLMVETPAYRHRLSNKILASYLDITQETLSRLKSK